MERVYPQFNTRRQMKRRSKAATETNWDEVRADYEGDVPVNNIRAKYRITQNLLYEKVEEFGWIRKKIMKRPVERLHRLIEQQIGIVEKKFSNRKTRPPNEKQIAQLTTLTKLLDQIVRLRKPLNEKNSIEAGATAITDERRRELARRLGALCRASGSCEPAEGTA
jgi:hypothetical protein